MHKKNGAHEDLRRRVRDPVLLVRRLHVPGAVRAYRRARGKVRLQVDAASRVPSHGDVGGCAQLRVLGAGGRADRVADARVRRAQRARRQLRELPGRLLRERVVAAPEHAWQHPQDAEFLRPERRRIKPSRCTVSAFPPRVPVPSGARPPRRCFSGVPSSSKL